MEEPANNLFDLALNLGKHPGERQRPAFSPSDVPWSTGVSCRMCTE